MFDALPESVFSTKQVPWPGTATTQDENRFLELAEEHFIQPLLYYQLKESGSLQQWPGKIWSSLQKEFHYQVSTGMATGSLFDGVLSHI